ncbi:MAG: aldehyde dehydrogenase family protein [Candidatus Velthaea sp.]
MTVSEISAEMKHVRTSADGTAFMYIAGEWCGASDGGTRDLYDPGTGERIGRVAEGTLADAARAIAAARAAFDRGPWPKTSAHDRAKVLFRVADLIEANATELARLETLNAGKPLRETEADVADAANCFRYYAGLATKPHGETFDVPGPSQTFTVREPIGVCGQIIPWNYPLLMAAWKLAPALAAGNVSILKPAELTPLTALRLAELFEAAGLPHGALSVVPGAGPIVGNAIAESHDVDKVAFTGGTATGRKIMTAATGNLKKVTLELGGKSPNVVFADADFETAVDYALLAIYAGCGQVCSAGSRLILDSAIYDRFVARLTERAQTIVVGNGFDPSTEMGPIVSPHHLANVERYIALGKEEGARLLCGGSRPAGDGLRGGNYLLPTIFSDTTPQMRIVREEIFGPVLVVQRFTTEEEAIDLANDTPYGLAGAVFTTDAARAHRVVRALRAGITWINTYHPTYNEAPWGGYKQSGIGRELGTYGFDEYTEVKQINVNLAIEPSGWFAH